MGSTMSPSDRRMVLTSRGAIMWRSSGTITVGPVTTMTAPKRAAPCHCMPMIEWASQAAPTPVIATPMVSRLRTGAPTADSLLMSRVRPPSKRMIATPRWIRGSRVPPRDSGLTRASPAGPHTTPRTSSGRIAGSWKRSARTWPAMPSATAATRVMMIIAPILQRENSEFGIFVADTALVLNSQF